MRWELNNENKLAQPARIMMSTILRNNPNHGKPLDIGNSRLCQCEPSHINCMTAKDWLKSQLGVWEFYYENRDIRDKKIHPATFPISLARKIIDLFSHEGELVLDPFVGSGTTLVAAADANRNAVGFDLQENYIKLCGDRLNEGNLFNKTKQIAIQDDALNIPNYLKEETVKLIFTSPPYANLLNRERKNKSRRDRDNEQLGKVEQYSQNPRDLGTMALEDYSIALGDIYEKLLPLLKIKGHCVINVPDSGLPDEQNEFCNICGKNVSWGSGRFVNRVPDFNDVPTRIDIGRKYPLGDFVCEECDIADFD